MSLPFAWVVMGGDIPEGPLARPALNMELPAGTKSLLVSFQQKRAVPLNPMNFTGNIVLSLTLLSDTVYYNRKFALGPYQSVVFNADGFNKLDLHCMAVTAENFELVVTATAGGEASSLGPLIFPESVIGPNVFCVPAGAEELIAATNDPGFAWEVYDQTGTVFLVPQAMVIGNSYPVAGTQYRPTGPFSGVWRIRQ